MQRVPALVVLLLSLLYLGVHGAGNRAARAQEPARPQAFEPSPSQSPPTEPPPAEPHVALLLPLESAAFGKAADAVRRGVYEARRVHPIPLPLVVYPTSDDTANIGRHYRAAVDAQARIVIGPLTRSAVSALAQSGALPVPTLALNSADAPLASPNLFFFGMQSEVEARQMAALAATQGHRRALVLVGKGQLAQRLAQTFVQEWKQLGNEVVREIQVSGETADFARLREHLPGLAPDMVFLALEAQPAKLARAYLGPGIPIYATSLVHTGDDPISRLDLDGISFADMPWLVSPDDPAVLAYAHAETGDLAFDLQRFYALGIDAYRLARALLEAQPDLSTLDGVTGRIVLEAGNHLTRRPRNAQFIEGALRVLPDDGPPSTAVER